MRILLISTSYPNTGNGSEAAGSFVEDFVYELVSQGHVVSVVFPVNELPTKSDSLNPIYFPFVVPSVPLSILSINNPLDWYRIITTLRAGDRAVSAAIDKFEPDFVFALWVLPSGYWALRHCARKNIRYGTWALGSDIWSLSRVWIIRSILKRTLDKSSLNFADGYELVRDVESLSKGSCSFLPSTRRLQPLDREPLRSVPPYRLTYIGRWHPNKGIDLLLEALESMDENFWKSILSIKIAGGGILENTVSESVARLTAHGKPVSLSGYVAKDEVSEILNQSDYLLIPSRIESIPVVFSDALQAGVPVVATPVGDMPELLGRFECGVLAEAISSESYAKALSDAITTSPTGFQKGVAEAARTFNLVEVVKNYIEKLKKQLAN